MPAPDSVKAVGLANGTQSLQGPGASLMHIFLALGSGLAMLRTTVRLEVGTWLPPLTSRLVVALRTRIDLVMGAYSGVAAPHGLSHLWCNVRKMMA